MAAPSLSYIHILSKMKKEGKAMIKSEIKSFQKLPIKRKISKIVA